MAATGAVTASTMGKVTLVPLSMLPVSNTVVPVPLMTLGTLTCDLCNRVIYKGNYTKLIPNLLYGKSTFFDGIFSSISTTTHPLALDPSSHLLRDQGGSKLIDCDATLV